MYHFSKSILFSILMVGLFSCGSEQNKDNLIILTMEEKQITFSAKNHDLDNNDNFSPDGRFLCYDTRATVYNESLANCKSIEKVEIETGAETVLWEPQFISGDQAAPGVAAASYHPTQNKIIFIHGPFLDEVEERGYYSIRNRTAMEVDGDGKGVIHKVDLRDIKNKKTTPGAHRGGTHRHEYTRKGNRIGFTYDDILIQNYGRTIGYMEPNEKTPVGYSHYFALIFKPVEESKSKHGDIVKANDDSWVDSIGTMRAFIGKVKAEDGVGFYSDLYVADIPLDLDITTANSGDQSEYPTSPKGIAIRRLTNGMSASGVVRGSSDGKRIAFMGEDKNGIDQLFVIKADGSEENPKQVTYLDSSSKAVRWHPSGEWLFAINGNNLIMVNVSRNEKSGKVIMLSNDDRERQDLVVSQDGNKLAYMIPTPTKDSAGEIQKDTNGDDFRQIYVMDLDWERINNTL